MIILYDVASYLYIYNASWCFHFLEAKYMILLCSSTPHSQTCSLGMAKSNSLIITKLKWEFLFLNFLGLWCNKSKFATIFSFFLLNIILEHTKDFLIKQLLRGLHYKDAWMYRRDNKSVAKDNPIKWSLKGWNGQRGGWNSGKQGLRRVENVGHTSSWLHIYSRTSHTNDITLVVLKVNLSLVLLKHYLLIISSLKWYTFTLISYLDTSKFYSVLLDIILLFTSNLNILLIPIPQLFPSQASLKFIARLLRLVGYQHLISH